MTKRLSIAVGVTPPYFVEEMDAKVAYSAPTEIDSEDNAELLELARSIMALRNNLGGLMHDSVLRLVIKFEEKE